MAFSTLPLSYCTNVHPGRTVEEVVQGVSQYTAKVRQRLDLPIAAGLWLPASAIAEIKESPDRLELLAQTLWQHDLCCYTLNAFPYGDFHSDRVKEQVYLPDWTSSDRVRYTRDCAAVLAQLLPEGGEGSISTVPLGGRMNPSGPEFHAACFRNLIQVGRYLSELKKETGRTIRLAVEPEPMCEMSSITQDTVPQFRALYEMADALGCEEVIRHYVGLCFDVCHQAVVFENVAGSIDELTDAGIRINKIHITNALELINPADNPEGRDALRNYVEPRYLHQTYARMGNGEILNRTDLLAEDIDKEPADRFLKAEAWRIHFHVPVFADKLGPLNTTRGDLKAALRKVRTLDYSPHLEVETYTWPVMPGDEEPDLADQITQELHSAVKLLSDLS
ncbi:MAG TPA: hypothetical protein DCG12_18210 [Planctomycetaceae bacterium]|nr:hypothetical protein [Planctomycetaceae bacterium]